MEKKYDLVSALRFFMIYWKILTEETTISNKTPTERLMKTCMVHILEQRKLVSGTIGTKEEHFIKEMQTSGLLKKTKDPAFCTH
jgi:hypothetical protein